MRPTGLGPQNIKVESIWSKTGLCFPLFLVEVVQNIHRFIISISLNVNNVGFHSIYIRRISFWLGIQERQSLASKSTSHLKTLAQKNSISSRLNQHRAIKASSATTWLDPLRAKRMVLQSPA